WFNAAFDRFTGWYAGLVRVLARVWPLSLLAFVGLVFGLYVLFGRIGTGFVPEEDQGYFMVMIDMPPASSFARTQAVTAEAAKILRGVPGVSDTVGVGGFDVVTFLQDPGMGAIFTLLKPWSERTTEALSVEGIMATARKRLEGISEARIGVINAPAIPGLSSTAGLELEIQDLGDRGPAALADVTEAYLAAARKRPELGPMLTTYSAGLPQRFLDVDRTKAMTLGVDLDDLFDTLQVNVGSMYVNQFNRYGRVYRTYVQAESEARASEDDLGRLRVRNAAGEMIDLNALATVKPMFGPFNVDRYNLYRSALVIGSASAGTSSGAAQQAMEEVADEVLPDGYTTQWTSTVYQQRQAGTVAPIIFCLSLVVVFLVLAAQYESWTMPLMVILAIPIGILGAIAGLILRKLDLDIYAQVGLLMLIGLTAKNAILIVQFAKVRREAGTPIMDAAVEAARIRLRPILMTALAFIFGVAPLAFASGAGAYARVGIGTVVGSGVLASTVLIVFVPLFYIVIQGARERVVGPPPEVRE
ncbi:MAG: efflux RND transporter permease subunit, partial [Phycisphaerales bacterium]|nr:efflux RND transporter permease subunit [Phycisphaerales bacterium]